MDLSSDCSQWSAGKQAEELKKLEKHFLRAEAEYAKFLPPQMVIKADDSWMIYAEKYFSDPDYQYPQDDFYYTNSELDKSAKGDRPSEAAAPYASGKLRRPHVNNATEQIRRTRDPCPTNSKWCRQHLRGRSDLLRRFVLLRPKLTFVLGVFIESLSRLPTTTPSTRRTSSLSWMKMALRRVSGSQLNS